MKEIIEPEKKIPVHSEADVVVVGGGPAGIGAALAAARNGAKTILIEQFAYLGGLSTTCINPYFMNVDSTVLDGTSHVTGGIMTDILKRLDSAGELSMQASLNTESAFATLCGAGFDTEYYKYLLNTMMEEAGVKLLLHAFVCGGVKEGSTLKGVIVESMEGRQVVLGKVVIDTTGSADVAWKSGTPVSELFFPAGPKKGRFSGSSWSIFFRNVDVDKFYCYCMENPEEWPRPGVGGKEYVKRGRAEGKLYVNRGTFSFIPIDGPGRIELLMAQYPLPIGHANWKLDDLTAGEIDLRKQSWSILNFIKKNLPGFEDARIEQTPNHLQRRGTHAIIGEYVLTYDDILKGKTFDDSVVIGCQFPDVFGPDDEHELICNVPLYDIPYRCLVPQVTENLLAAGMCISADFMVHNATRHTRTSMCTGQVAGTAAALSVKHKVTPRKLDVKLLQKTLIEQGAKTSVRNVPKEIVEQYQKNATGEVMSFGPSGQMSITEEIKKASKR